MEQIYFWSNPLDLALTYDPAIPFMEVAMLSLLWSLVGLLVVLWLLGFTLHIAGNLIHLVLLLAIALAIYNFATNRDAGQR